MKDNLRSILNKHNISPFKITIKNNTKIVESENGCFVLKKKSNNNLSQIYNYLKSRSFDYFPDIVIEDEEYDIYRNINEIDEPIEQKAIDIMNLLSILHSKTTFYKEIDIEDYKIIYESVSNNIEYLTEYYEGIINNIGMNVYMSPSEYLIIRNSSKIFFSLEYAKKELDKWYELVKEKRNMRVVNIHNNIDLSHYIKTNDKSYFISWNKSKIDMPIMDLYKFYKNHYLDFDFMNLFKVYESRYPLLVEEKKLLYILMALPDLIEVDTDEYRMCKKTRNIIDYLYKTESLLTENTPPKTTK